MLTKNGREIVIEIFDIHSHMVPFVDDGSSSFEMAMETLYSAYKQGARNIVCSSHSWGNSEKYFKNFKELKNQADKKGIGINLYIGCEINCSNSSIDDIIYQLDIGELCTINETEYVLVEFDYYEDINKIFIFVKELNANGYKPVIAHLERYVNLREHREFIPFLNNAGALFQVNAYSLYDEKDVNIKEFARWLLDYKFVSFIGSDSHRTNHRPYAIKNGINYILKNCNSEYANNICYKNAERMFNFN